MTGKMTEANPRNARRTILLLVLLFLGPVAVAWVLYAQGNWAPAGRVNHGELITPPQVLPEVVLELLAQEGTGDVAPRQRWSLVWVGDGACAEVCTEVLLKMSQVHRRLGRRYDRVQRAFLYKGPVPDQSVAHDTELTVVALGDAVTSVFEGLGYERLFVVDPIGNAVLGYDPDFERVGLLNDLERLLQLSSIG